MQLRTVLIILLALVFGVCAAAGVNIFLRAQSLNAAPAEETVAVVVAAADINRWSKIESNMITTRQIPKSMVPKGAITKDEEALKCFTLRKCAYNEILLSSNLKKGDIGGMREAIPNGMRALTIQTTKITGVVGGFLMPRDRVDVLLSVNPPTPNKNGTIALTLLTNVEVLAVDDIIEAPDEKKTKAADIKSVTLLVNPKQAAKLILAEDKGKLYLSLRNHKDDEEVDPTRITLKDLGLVEEREQKEKPRAAPVIVRPEPPKPLHIRMLRNTAESQVLLQPSTTVAQVGRPKE